MLFPVIMLFLFHHYGQSRMSNNRYQELTAELDVKRISARPAGIFLKPFLQSRTPGSEGSRAVQLFLLQHFSFLGWKTEVDQFEQAVPPSSARVKFTNLVFTLNPNAKRKLVLAAHYDSKVSVDGQQYVGQFIGATDSAWPCALMCELAFALTSRLAKSPSFDDVTLQMIFFDGEEAQVHWNHEDSIYGARHLAAEWAKDRANRLDNIEMFVLLDLLGAAAPKFYPIMPKTRNQFEALAAVESSLMATLGNHNRRYFNPATPSGFRGVSVEDDHVPFMNLGVPILHLIPLPFPKVWHKLSDDESALDNHVIADLTLILHAYLKEYFRLDVKAGVHMEEPVANSEL